MITLYDCKVSFLQSHRTFFPDRPISPHILSANGKTHPQFMKLQAVLAAHRLDPKRYIPWVFSNAERPPRVPQLLKSDWIVRYQQAHPQIE